MKENEAPEKIYIFENPISGTPDDRWLSKKSDENDIEYTRTDVFMEKACDYLQKNLWRMVVEEGEFRQRFVTDFKYYMKGE